MRIDYLIVADAINESGDGRLNVLGANWRAFRMDTFPSTRPMAIAFAASTTDESELGTIPIVVELDEPSGRSAIMEQDFELVRVEGIEGVPVGSMSALTSGFLQMDGPGLYRVTARVGSARADQSFVVYGPPTEKGKGTVPTKTRRGRGSGIPSEGR